MGAKPKNIIFIMADQMGACHVNCYGSGVPSTPTLDALAARGTRFSRCYATSPVCTPNRASILTGRSPAVHGMISNNYTLQGDTATYAQVLKHHGYHVGGFGKFHHCPMPLEHPESYSYLGFDETVITEDPKWEAWTEWVRKKHPEHFEAALAVAWGTPRGDGPHPDPRYDAKELSEIRSRIMQPLRDASPWPMVYTSPLPAEVHQTAWITDLAIDYMDRRQTAAPDDPFFTFVSYVDPHDPYDPPKPYDEMFDPADMPDPIPAAWREEGNNVLKRSQNWQKFEEMADNADVIKRLRAHYHGSIRFIDDQIARIVKHVEERGLWDDTIIVFTTDHGEMLGDHALMTKGVKPYDAGIRCPLIVAGGGIHSGVSDRLTCALDFFPTFCDWGSVDDGVRPPLEGKSIAGTCSDELDGDTWESVQVAMSKMESVISNDGWRLTLFNDPESPNQLINLNDDPSEQRNRYNDPSCAEIRTRMLEQMVCHNVRIRTTSQYRNLPIKDDKKYEPGGAGNGQLIDPVPVYCDPSSTPVW